LRSEQENESAVPIDYLERVNRAIDHIIRNLGEPLRLGNLCSRRGSAGRSPTATRISRSRVSFR
jgi:hypothetical protein